MKTRLSKKLLLTIGLAGAVGFAYLMIGLLYVPDLAQFQVTGILDGGRTEYRPGERITVEPFLTYTGRKQVAIWGGTPLFFADVYTAENEKVFERPVLRGVLVADLLWHHTLSPNVPFNDEYQWPGSFWIAVPHPYHPDMGYSYDPDVLRFGTAYRFRLEQPGRYKIVVRAEFSVGPVGERVESTVYSEPIWVQIHGWP